MEIKNRQIIGNIGMFYVAYKLSLLGFYVLPTIRNSKGPDIIIYKDNYMAQVQVKALSKINDINVGRNAYSSENVKYWLVVIDCLSNNIGCLVIPLIDIKEGIEKCKSGINSYENLVVCDYAKKDGTINNFWLNRKMLNKESMYYNNWKLLK